MARNDVISLDGILAERGKLEALEEGDFFELDGEGFDLNVGSTYETLEA